MFTIDTSVWINADSPAETNHASSRAFVDRIYSEKISVIVPTLLRVEIAGTIARMTDDTVRAKAFADALSKLSFVQWISLDERISERALEMAADQRSRGADAVYAAVALEYGCKLVSLDNEHLKRLTKVLDVMTPHESLAQLNRGSP
jgi:predicted nucleic acid-binding protein